jgi:GT2 family glycosyltransferase
MKIEIVISAYNNLDMTKMAYNTLKKYTDISYKITIIENKSLDGSRDWVYNIKDDNLKKIFPENNVGGVGARNLGIRSLDKDTDYVVFSDNDVVYTEKWASRIYEFMKNHKEIGISGPCSNFAGNPQLVSGIPQLSLNDEEEIQNISKNIYDKKKGSFTLPPKDWPVVGFCMIVDKKVIDKIGEFDENLVAGWDDTDYCRRTTRNGFGLAYINYVYIHHWGHASKSTVGAHSTPETIKSREYMLRKWGWI